MYLEYESPPSDPDRLSLLMCRPDDSVVGALTATDEEENWELLSELETEASRIALGWDDVLTDITSALEAETPVGIERVSPQQVDASIDQFGWMQGKWRLTYCPKGGQTNEELVEIGPERIYSVHGIPCFKLTDMVYDQDHGTLLFTKTYLQTHPRYNQRRPEHHREQLRVLSENSLVGHRVGEPSRTLEYTRLPSK